MKGGMVYSGCYKSAGRVGNSRSLISVNYITDLIRNWAELKIVYRRLDLFTYCLLNELCRLRILSQVTQMMNGQNLWNPLKIKNRYL